MKIIKILFFSFFLLTLNSCVTGIYKMIRGYEHYVEINVNGREELKKKKFKDKFKIEMSEKIIYDKVYHNFYQDSTINLQSHSYIRLFKTGQFAIFYSKIDNINTDEISNASAVGYYIVKNGILKLERSAGGLRTGNYKIISKYAIGQNSLKEQGRKNRHREEHKIEENIKINTKLKPDW